MKIERDGREVLYGVNDFMSWNDESVTAEDFIKKAKSSGVVALMNEKLESNVQMGAKDTNANVSLETAYQLYNQICLAMKSGKISQKEGENYFQVVSSCASDAVLDSDRFDKAVMTGRKIAKALLENKEIRGVIQSNRSSKKQIFPDVREGYNGTDEASVAAKANLEKMLSILRDAVGIDAENLELRIKPPSFSTIKVDSWSDMDDAVNYSYMSDDSFYDKWHVEKAVARKEYDLKGEGMYCSLEYQKSDGSVKGLISLYPAFDDCVYADFLPELVLNLCTYKQYRDYAELRNNSSDVWCEKNGKIPEEVMAARFTHVKDNSFNIFEQERIVIRNAFASSLARVFMLPNTDTGRKLQDIVIKKLDEPCKGEERDELRAITRIGLLEVSKAHVR